jgi:hypothetical protein
LSWVPWGSTNLPWCWWCPNMVFTMATKFMIQLYPQSGQNCVHTRLPWQLSLITLFSEVLKFSNFFSKSKILWRWNLESSGIFYFVKWKFQN